MIIVMMSRSHNAMVVGNNCGNHLSSISTLIHSHYHRRASHLSHLKSHKEWNATIIPRPRATASFRIFKASQSKRRRDKVSFYKLLHRIIITQYTPQEPLLLSNGSLRPLSRDLNTMTGLDRGAIVLHWGPKNNDIVKKQ